MVLDTDAAAVVDEEKRVGFAIMFAVDGMDYFRLVVHSQCFFYGLRVNRGIVLALDHGVWT